jgi:hypothetical protein
VGNVWCARHAACLSAKWCLSAMCWILPTVRHFPCQQSRCQHWHYLADTKMTVPDLCQTFTSSGSWNLSWRETLFLQHGQGENAMTVLWRVSKKIISISASKNYTADGKSVQLPKDNTLRMLLCNLKFASSVDNNMPTIGTFWSNLIHDN